MGNQVSFRGKQPTGQNVSWQGRNEGSKARPGMNLRIDGSYFLGSPPVLVRLGWPIYAHILTDVFLSDFDSNETISKEVKVTN